ncbi:hydroxymethylglutaryl-CoA lyase [Alteromonas sp. 345S023]|uniref:hydroxymethylglutaryl-CoA lyase n=1 Tax=Alteromonas profundi TaxID=2696062 RepID=A0A7X5LIL1_9ALTE|nr:hydroxymethylglutaryl-CoA lyase [Alteromonas profundi]NDV89994.1 hydroxymethylglutaryl-CoA lyase [Alteromonas profundi]
MALPKKVRLVEVGPRDGLQNEKAVLSVDNKVTLVELLAKSGLSYIEAGSFVSPKWVPQMANSNEVFDKIERQPHTTYTALTPNMKGLEAALESGVDEVAIFGSASESFSQKNINCSIDESLARFDDVTRAALEKGMKVRGYVSCVMGCPYEGQIAPQAVLNVSRKLLDMGCYEVSLGDTIGVGTPYHTKQLLEVITPHIDANAIGVHFHDTYGQALANIYAALEFGIASIDSAIAGLGGCPYAKGASGNVASEDVLYMLDGMGIETGVDMQGLLRASHYITKVIGRPPMSKVANALMVKNP